MRDRDVPQEGNATLAGLRKAVYAVAEARSPKSLRACGVWVIPRLRCVVRRG